MSRFKVSLRRTLKRPKLSSRRHLQKIHQISSIRSKYSLYNVEARVGSKLAALETYRTTHLRSPHFAIEPFVKALCNLYGVAYRSSLRDIFSTAYDFYLRLREQVDDCVMSALNRVGDWRRRNACSACTYKLKDEEKLTFSTLTTMDGNGSLKSIIR